MNRDSTKARRICWDTHKFTGPLGRPVMECSWCKGTIDPVAGDKWRADHIRRHAEGGEETADNLWPIHESCDREHKAPNDTREVAKGKRMGNKHFGIERRKKRWKPAGMTWSWSERRYVRAGSED